MNITPIIRAWGDDDTQHILDIKGKQSFPTNYKLADVLELKNARTGYNKNIDLPATKRNIEYFGAFWDVNETGHFNHKRKKRAILEFNTVAVLDGYIQLIDVKIDKKEFAEFSVRVFSEESQFINGFGQKLLRDADLSAFDHFATLANVVGGFDGMLSDTVFYGLQDYGDQLTAEGAGASNIYNDLHVYLKCKPYINVKEVFDIIMKEAGYTYESDFLNGAYFGSIYMLAHRGGAELYFPTEEIHLFKAGFLVDQAVSTGVNAYTELPFEDETSLDYFDPYDVHQFDQGEQTAGTGSAFYLSYNTLTAGWVKLRLNLNFNNPTTTTGVYTIELWKREPGGVDTFAQTLGAHTAPGLGTSFFSTEALVYQVGYHYLRVKNGFSGSPAGVVILSNIKTWFECFESPRIPLDSVPVGYTWPLVMADNVSQETKQSEIIEWMDGKFNLMFINSKTNAKHLIIEPYTDYVGAGDKKDWSKKIDFNKVYSISGMPEKKEVTFTTKEGEDILNAVVKNEADRIYGRQKFINDTNDFATGTKEISTPDVVSPLNALTGSDIMIPRLFTLSVDPVKGDLRLFVKGDTIDIDDFDLIDYFGNSETVEEYTHFGHYSEPIPDADDNDLNFGQETPFHTIVNKPTQTAYQRFWSKYLDQIYGDEARLLKGFFKLSLKDIEDFEWSDRIYALNAWWIVNQISGFDPMNQGSTQVELIRHSATLSVLKPVTQTQDYKSSSLDLSKGNSSIYVTHKQLKSDSRQYIAGQGATVKTLADGTTEIDFTESNMWEIELTQNTTLQNPTNDMPTSGVIFGKQDATGGRTFDFGSNWLVAGDTIPTGAGEEFSISFYSDGNGRLVANIVNEEHGTPSPYIITAVDYSVVLGDRFVEATDEVTITLPALPTIMAEPIDIINSSNKDIVIDTTDASQIEGAGDFTLKCNEVLSVISNGTQWKVI